MFDMAIFDLDNTLFDTDQIPLTVLDPVMELIRKEPWITNTALSIIEEECRRISFDELVRRHQFPLSLIRECYAAYSSIILTEPIYPFADWHLVTAFSNDRVLVTSGIRAFQSQKITLLNIAHGFSEIVIDGIDDESRKHKEQIFDDLIEGRGARRESVLIVGDSPSSELEAGRRLGCVTAQILRRDIPVDPKADFHSIGLADLAEYFLHRGSYL